MEEETYAAYGRPICRGNVHSRHSPPQPARALAQSGDYRSRVQISAPRSTESPAQAGFSVEMGVSVTLTRCPIGAYTPSDSSSST